MFSSFNTIFSSFLPPYLLWNPSWSLLYYHISIISQYTFPPKISNCLYYFDTTPIFLSMFFASLFCMFFFIFPLTSTITPPPLPFTFSCPFFHDSFHTVYHLFVKYTHLFHTTKHSSINYFKLPSSYCYISNEFSVCYQHSSSYICSLLQFNCFNSEICSCVVRLS